MVSRSKVPPFPTLADQPGRIEVLVGIDHGAKGGMGMVWRDREEDQPGCYHFGTAMAWVTDYANDTPTIRVRLWKWDKPAPLNKLVANPVLLGPNTYPDLPTLNQHEMLLYPLVGSAGDEHQIHQLAWWIGSYLRDSMIAHFKKMPPPRPHVPTVCVGLCVEKSQGGRKIKGIGRLYERGTIFQTTLSHMIYPRIGHRPTATTWHHRVYGLSAHTSDIEREEAALHFLGWGGKGDRVSGLLNVPPNPFPASYAHHAAEALGLAMTMRTQP